MNNKYLCNISLEILLVDLSNYIPGVRNYNVLKFEGIRVENLVRKLLTSTPLTYTTMSSSVSTKNVCMDALTRIGQNILSRPSVISSFSGILDGMEDDDIREVFRISPVVVLAHFWCDADSKLVTESDITRCLDFATGELSATSFIKGLVDQPHEIIEFTIDALVDVGCVIRSVKDRILCTDFMFNVHASSRKLYESVYKVLAYSAPCELSKLIFEGIPADICLGTDDSDVIVRLVDNYVPCDSVHEAFAANPYAYFCRLRLEGSKIDSEKHRDGILEESVRQRTYATYMMAYYPDIPNNHKDLLAHNFPILAPLGGELYGRCFPKPSELSNAFELIRVIRQHNETSLIGILLDNYTYGLDSNIIDALQLSM